MYHNQSYSIPATPQRTALQSSGGPSEPSPYSQPRPDLTSGPSMPTPFRGPSQHHPSLQHAYPGHSASFPPHGQIPDAYFSSTPPAPYYHLHNSRVYAVHNVASGAANYYTEALSAPAAAAPAPAPSTRGRKRGAPVADRSKAPGAKRKRRDLPGHDVAAGVICLLHLIHLLSSCSWN